MPETRQKEIPNLACYALLGRSGLRVSPLCLGTMTFGTEWGWGSAEETARDPRWTATSRPAATSSTPPTATPTARARELSASSSASAETATAWCWPPSSRSTPSRATPTPAATGARTSTARSRGRCGGCRPTTSTCTGCTPGTALTPMEEVLSTLDDARARRQGALHRLLRRARVVPRARADDRRAARLGARLRAAARVLARRAQHRARARARRARARHGHLAVEPARQRHAHRQVPARHDDEGDGAGRLGLENSNPGFQALHRRNWQIVDALVAVATEVGRRPAQVALNWVARRPAVASIIIGATSRHSSTTTSPRSPSSCPSRSGEARRGHPAGDRSPVPLLRPEMQQMMTGGTRCAPSRPGTAHGNDGPRRRSGVNRRRRWGRRVRGLRR